ncbi:hypothetical protein [Streptomyces sp. NBC_00207]|uniref:hypothetical protein n=1 Tax=Streptomyces sp. NBC_00207 TaxID=2903635 RepID=UPI00324537FF
MVVTGFWRLMGARGVLAEEFGYAVSPGPAGRVPGVREKIAEGDRHWRKLRRSNAVCAALLAAGVCGALFSSVLGVAVVAAVAVGLCVGVAAWPSELPARRREAMEMVRRRPWQVWPCRLEPLGSDASSPMVTADVLLLAPDRTVAAALRGLMPRPDWLAMTDGRGLLWFCGDLRVGGWVARPADVVGSLTWMDRVDPPVTIAESAPHDIALKDVVIRAATSTPVWSLLFDL